MTRRVESTFVWKSCSTASSGTSRRPPVAREGLILQLERGELTDAVRAHVIDEDVNLPLLLDDELYGFVYGRVAQRAECDPLDVGA
jgi:hypothetical protein